MIEALSWSVGDKNRKLFETRLASSYTIIGMLTAAQPGRVRKSSGSYQARARARGIRDGFFCSSADRERQGPVRNAAEAAKIEHLWLESGIISKTAASSSVSIEGAPACLVGVLKSELRLPVRGQRGTDEANSDFLQLREPSLGFLPSPTVSVALQKDCERSDAYV